MYKSGMAELNYWKLNLRLGYNFSSSITGIQLGLSRYEYCIRLDILFFGIYLGVVL